MSPFQKAHRFVGGPATKTTSARLFVSTRYIPSRIRTTFVMRASPATGSRDPTRDRQNYPCRQPLLLPSLLLPQRRVAAQSASRPASPLRGRESPCASRPTESSDAAARESGRGYS